MNLKKELYNKLTYNEWSICHIYIEKAQECYSVERYSDARESLMDAIAVCASAGESNAASKIQYYLNVY